MTYPNPHYDPEWQAACNYHFAEAERLQGDIHRLAAGGGETYAAYREAEAEFQRHHQAGMATYKRQHKTVQEYAAWVFQTFPVTVGQVDTSLLTIEVDLETWRTVEEVDAAWSHHRHIAETVANDQRFSLPIGQPEGLEAFADATSPSLTRRRRDFTPRDLYPDGYPGTAGVWTIMTTEEQADGWHICFTHRWSSPGISVTNAIERLATAVYREACAIAADQLLGRGTAPLDPGRFHFYDHTPLAPSGSLREDFSRVELTFVDGGFKNPQWRRYPVIPKVIQSARFDLAKGTRSRSINERGMLAGQPGKADYDT